MSRSATKKPLRAKASDVERLLTRYYSGPCKFTSSGWVIRCPSGKHSDRNPSCNVFHSGIFYCWSCGYSMPPQVGFQALGADPADLEEIFGDNPIPTSEAPEKFPSLGEMETSGELGTDDEPLIKLLSEEDWPLSWAFRGLATETIGPKGPLAPFAPKLVQLALKTKLKGFRREPFPRISFGFPSNPLLRLHLRLSHEQEPKVINGPGVGEEIGRGFPFGLKEWKLPSACKYLMVVEGPYDLFRTIQNLWLLGLLGEVVPFSILGTHQWDKFFEQFQLHLSHQMRGRRIILGFDNDDPGKMLAAKAQTDLRTQCLLASTQVLWFPYLVKKKDPGDLNVKDFRASWTHLFGD